MSVWFRQSPLQGTDEERQPIGDAVYAGGPVSSGPIDKSTGEIYLKSGLSP